MVQKKSVNYTFPNGEVIELFFIGTLAFSLGRASDTLRKWEIAGILPDTCFRDKMGQRLYSKEQIDVVVKAATECKISQGKPIRKTLFTKMCFDGFEALKVEYKKKSEVKDESK